MSSRLEQLFAAFVGVSMRDRHVGDRFGIDVPPEDLQRLVRQDQQSLTARDLAGVVGYCSTPELICYLLPGLMRVWSIELERNDTNFTGHLHYDMGRFDIVARFLTKTQRNAVLAYARQEILDLLSRNRRFPHTGITMAHRWPGILASYGVWTDDVQELWRDLWDVRCEGHAASVIEFISCIVCVDGENPVFVPWTINEGGGPPRFWEYDSIGFGEFWKAENLSFLLSMLTGEFLEERLTTCVNALSDKNDRAIAHRVLYELEAHEVGVRQKCRRLAEILATPSSQALVVW